MPQGRIDIPQRLWHLGHWQLIPPLHSWRAGFRLVSGSIPLCAFWPELFGLRLTSPLVKEPAMRLTNPNAWHTFAGGTCAASDRHSFQAITSIGQYCVDPVSSRHNVECHIGYSVRFATNGAVPGLQNGLWRSLSPSLVTLPEARRLCQAHHAEHGAELHVPS